MLNQGHALAAAAGIPCLVRRTYRNPTEPAGIRLRQLLRVRGR
jgi:hypothetical protein